MKSSDHQGCLIIGLAVWHSIGHLHVSVECLTEHSRSNLVCRICNILFLEFLIDSLNLPMLFPAKLVDMMSNSLHMKIIYCRWVLFPTMIPLEKFIHQPCLAYRMINSALFCSIWLTGSMPYLFKEVQAKKITLSNYLWIMDQRPLILSLSKSFLTLHNYNMPETFE